MWKTTDELLADVHLTLQELRASGDVETAHAECRLYNVAAKVVGIAAEHARLTGRLEGDVIPAATIGGNAGAKPKAKRLPSK